MSNSNIPAFRNGRELLIARATGTNLKPVQHMSSGDLRHLKNRINSTTHGKISVISGFEKFKCNLVSSLKLFFLWGFQGRECDKTGHVLIRVDGGGYEPQCSRCGELMCAPEDLTN